MANRLVSVDDNFNFPEGVTERQAQRLRDGSSVEGAAVVAGTRATISTQKGVPFGLASLDAGGKVPSALLPSDIGGPAGLVLSNTRPTSAPIGTVWIPTAVETNLLDTHKGLLARWQANAATSENGSPIGALAPKAGAWSTPLEQSVAGNQPTLIGNAINGRKALRFRAASNQFLYADTPDTLAPITAFFVFNLSTRGQAVFGANALTAPWIGVRSHGTEDSIRLNSEPVSTGGPSSPWSPATGWVVAAGVWDGTTSRIYTNKLTPAVGNTGTGSNVGLAHLRIARTGGSSGTYADLDLADLAFVSGALPDAEVRVILNELATLYNVTLAA